MEIHIKEYFLKLSEYFQNRITPSRYLNLSKNKKKYLFIIYF